jgi:hypothetical protein
MQPVPTDRRSARRLETTPRRTRLRLRELCDEVLASYRVATGRSTVSDADRAEAQSIFQSMLRPRR